MVIDEDVRIANEADEVVLLRLGQVFCGGGLGCAGFRRTGILDCWFPVGEGGREFAAKFQCQCVFFGADGFAVFAAGQERVHDLVSVKLRGHAIDQLGLLGARDQLGDLQAGGHVAGIKTARVRKAKGAEIAGYDFLRVQRVAVQCEVRRLQSSLGDWVAWVEPVVEVGDDLGVVERHPPLGE